MLSFLRSTLCFKPTFFYLKFIWCVIKLRSNKLIDWRLNYHHHRRTKQYNRNEQNRADTIFSKSKHILPPKGCKLLLWKFEKISSCNDIPTCLRSTGSLGKIDFTCRVTYFIVINVTEVSKF